MDQFQKIFIDEASDLIQSLESLTIEIEKEPENKDIIAQVFRVMHSLKGAAGMFSFQVISDYTHNLETIYDQVRNNIIKIDKDLINITYKSVDHLRNLLSDPKLSDKNIKYTHENLLSEINDFINSTNIDYDQIENNIKNDNKLENFNNTYYIYFKPNENIFINGTNPLFILSDLNELGKCKAFKKINNIPPLEELEVKKSYFSWEIILTTNLNINEIREVFIFIEDNCDLNIIKIADCNLVDAPFLNEFLEHARLSDVTMDIEWLKNRALDCCLNYNNSKNEEFKSGGTQIESNDQNIFTINDKNTDEKSLKEKIRSNIDNSENYIKQTTKSNIKVSSEKIDELMNLVSELVTTQAELGVLANQSGITRLTTVAENIEKISRRLRDNALNICLIPLEEVIVQFKRLVRNLSIELNKEIIFVTEGTETELDKRIIDNIREPFVHILRNAIDHGIEDTQTRIKSGKPKEGKITLKAYYSGAEVHIQIIDNGKGINPDVIRKKAIDKGIINNSTILTKKEILELVFHPGFSTAEKITDVSGRGVGMDVVKRKIEEIKGIVEIDSEIGIGTTITIKLPLSLSIIDALLVKIGCTHFLIPLQYVIKCDEATNKDIENSINNRLIIDDEPISFINLRHEFQIKENRPQIERLIIVKYEDVKLALVVDSIVGEHQAVLKPLGEIKAHQDIISGASILGDGSVALVIDTSKLIKFYYFKKKKEVINIKSNNNY